MTGCSKNLYYSTKNPNVIKPLKREFHPMYFLRNIMAKTLNVLF